MKRFEENLFMALATVYVVYLLVPIFQFVSGLNVSVVSLVTFVGVFILYPKAFFNRISFAGLVYLFVLLLYYFVDKKLPGLGAGKNTEMMRLIIATAFILPNIAIFYVLQDQRSDRLYRYFTWMPLITLVVSFITFTSLILHDNEILRQTSYMSAERVNSYLPHYSLLHAYILVVPSTLLAFKLIDDKSKYFFLFVTIYTFFVIAKSSITTTIVMAIVVFVFMLMYSEQSDQKSLARALGVSFILFFLLQAGVIEGIMNAVVDFYKDTGSASKMRLFRDMLIGNEITSGNSLETRGNLHQVSVDAFFANPLTGSDKVGEHSCLLDRLGGLGLLGFIPYVIFLYSVFKGALNAFRLKSIITGFYVVAACALLLLYEKGTFGQECWLFLLVIAPSILHYLESIRLKDNELS